MVSEFSPKIPVLLIIYNKVLYCTNVFKTSKFTEKGLEAISNAWLRFKTAIKRWTYLCNNIWAFPAKEWFVKYFELESQLAHVIRDPKAVCQSSKPVLDVLIGICDQPLQKSHKIANVLQHQHYVWWQTIMYGVRPRNVFIINSL